MVGLPPPTESTIGNTMYCKHWFFAALTRIINFVKEHEDQSLEEEETNPEMEADMENEICKVWDMCMDEEVSRFLLENNIIGIILGVVAKSKCKRLVEICVGILANMACFKDICMTITTNEDVGLVVFFLYSDTDPSTLLETTRLLLTCLSHTEVLGIWMERIRNHPSIRHNLFFIMSSSTNVDLLYKVGELVDKLFDMDEDLMINWIKACQQPEAADAEGVIRPAMPVVPTLLEASKQLRIDSPEGLNVYMHLLQLVTTVDEGVKSIVLNLDVGKETWKLLFELATQDLFQPDDPPLVVVEQKAILVAVFSVLSLIYSSQMCQEFTEPGKNLPLIISLMCVLENLEIYGEFHSDHLSVQGGPDAAIRADPQLRMLKDVCCEFLSNIFWVLKKENILEALGQKHVTEEKCLCTLRNMLPVYNPSVNRFLTVLAEANQELSDTMRKKLAAMMQ
nr:TPA: hypothetical protein GDO54_003020 [Pyxicephalus adspersus]DBA17598.1 TPA: hypothetical protein GDO54_003020 [Pyxicephalus adspersus]